MQLPNPGHMNRHYPPKVDNSVQRLGVIDPIGGEFPHQLIFLILEDNNRS
jgi:hypothetical protein